MKTATKVFLGLGAAVLMGGGYAYLVTGRREEDSPFIPNIIEDRIDQLVALLDQHFGKRWVNRGLDALQRALESSYPALTTVLGAVFTAEQQGIRLGWAGYQKRAFAAEHLRHAYA